MIKNLKVKLLEIGKIKCGKLGQERSTRDGKNTYRLPTKLKHFLVTTTQRDETGNFTPDVALMKQIAETVNEPWDHLISIPVYLIFNSIDENFFTTYTCYKGKSLICTGNGETATDLTTGEEISCPCPRLDKDYKGPTKCKIYGRLNMVLQNMDICGGSWVLRTTSWNTVQDILGSLMLIQKIAGRLAGIPLMLKLFPRTVQLPTGQATVYTTSLIYMGSPYALAEEARQHPMLEHSETLAPDQDITPDEEEEIQEEFYPPSGAEEDEAAGLTEQAHKKRKTRGSVSLSPDKPAKTKAASVSPSRDKPKEKTAADLAQENMNQKVKDEIGKLEKASVSLSRDKNAEGEKEEEFPESPIDTALKTAKKEKVRVVKEKAEVKEKPPIEETPIPGEEVVDGPPEDFGWV